MTPIDLRSDTLTAPTDEMRDAMRNAQVGDDGRTDAAGRGGDASINALENYAAALLGKEAALFCTSGTMGNVVALATHCTRADKVAVEPDLHVVRTEKAPFMPQFFGLIKQPYACSHPGMADLTSFEAACTTPGVKLACIENSHNFAGGVCASLPHMKQLYAITQSNGLLMHMDGARLFNAATYLGTTAQALAACADSVMFCLSKGLGAPYGSMLCGSQAFIQKARETRRLLGGGLRQGGIMAAAGLVALKTGMAQLEQDHENARSLGAALGQFATCQLVPVQTNIVMLDITQTGQTSGWFEQGLAPLGLLVKGMGDNYLRLTTYRGISPQNIRDAVCIFANFMQKNQLA